MVSQRSDEQDAVELISSFVNTVEKYLHRPDDESLVSPEALAAWMDTHDIRAGAKLGAEDLARALEFREAVRALLGTNNGRRIDRAAIAVLRDATGEGLIQVRIEADGRASAEPAATGVPALYARSLAAVTTVQAGGRWDRLKACAADDCQYAFFDSSRNRSRTWCSMEVCGNRAKTRAYRARRVS
jgi:predicted RNA-binding Zn ribbon-like protein